jgi:2-polyprenyl-3-methyl-5-hydroxy-6-metoxy-1,4-benzoquinol methylase
MKEIDIRPQHLLERYLELSAQDAELCFSSSERIDFPCIACGGKDSQFQFKKNGFSYAQCEQCGTLYQTPRPTIQAYEEFYRNSVSSQFWAEQFFPVVAEARREKIFRPRVERLSSLCHDNDIQVQTLVEVGSGFGIFLEEWRKSYPEVKALAIEPSKSLADECRRKGFEVIEEIAENVQGCDGLADLVVCFEVLEHVYDPLSFLKTISKMAKPGGYVFLSTLGVDGFDIQMLWEQSNSIFPPHHINFFSVKGFKELFQRAGLTNIDITTPGVLDVDIVRNAAKKNPSILAQHRFLRDVLECPEKSVAFQSFLSENCLSSHTWVLGQIPFCEGEN